MGSAADRPTGGDVRDAGMLDLSVMPLAGLLALAGREDPLAMALRHRLADDGGHVLSAFSSFLGNAGR